MRIFRDLKDIPDDARGAVAALGNFDGVHLGHQAVIATAEAVARRTHAPLGLVTFEPHPRSYFAPDAAPFRLMNPAARASRLEKLGVDILFEVPFDADLAALSAEGFVENILSDKLGLSHVVTGADFRFGKGRLGDTNALRDLAATHDIAVTTADMIDLGDKPISSTAIRTALSEGQPRDAARMLGHLHRIEGPVEHGEKRGRELGYPTANMSIANLHPPRFGVYAVRVDVLTGPQAGSYKGAASIGVRPMFGENTANCETFIFDFSGDLYGQTLSVALVEFLRPELKFQSLDALMDQMAKDCDMARDLLTDD